MLTVALHRLLFILLKQQAAMIFSQLQHFLSRVSLVQHDDLIWKVHRFHLGELIPEHGQTIVMLIRNDCFVDLFR